MAKQKSRAMSPAQLKKLTNLDTTEVSKLTYRQLQRIVSPLRKEAVRRMNTLEKSVFYSPALEQWKKSGTVTQSIKGATRNQLLSQYIELRKFTSAKSSTVTGARNIRRERNKMIGGALPADLEKTFWDVWTEFTGMEGNYEKATAKDDLKELRKIIKSGESDFGTIIYKLRDIQTQRYELAEEERINEENEQSIRFPTR